MDHSPKTRGEHRVKHPIEVASHDLIDLATVTGEDACRRLGVSNRGLTPEQASDRLKTIGPNRIAEKNQTSVLIELWQRFLNPLNLLLLVLAGVSWALSDLRSALVIVIMVVLSVGLGFIQEHRSSAAAAKLAQMVSVKASVRRQGANGSNSAGFIDIPLEEVVPGDVVQLAAGDLIPADLRLLDAKDLYVNQSTLTGESMPAEKISAPVTGSDGDLFALQNLCFMGSNVTSGFGTGLIVHTGRSTYFGQLADKVVIASTVTSFERGMDRFVWLMVRFILVMAPTVFLINGLTKHNWLEALFFAVAVAVGLTPEMLPMIVTVNLAKGAIAMSRKRVIVKRLNAIQNFGAMDVLCTDKTGTLTQDRVILKLHVDVEGQEDDRVLDHAYLNSHFQSGLRNLMDEAVLHHVEQSHPAHAEGYVKLDEIPFDFTRRRLSVLVQKPGEKPLMVCKGAVEEVFSACTRYQFGAAIEGLDPGHLAKVQDVTSRLNRDGFRVLAVACRTFDEGKGTCDVTDERDMTLLGFVAFLDPPKETVAAAIRDLHASGVAVKVLTGDNDLVTRKICRDVGLDIGRLVLGNEVDSLDDEALAELAEAAQVFAKVSPAQKARVIAALQRHGHVVGFLGDGINDGPGLKAADVGISVDTAVDIAKESADIILLEKSLTVLKEGVLEGRRVFGNIVKYIKMGASSNFGNMFSVLGASIFLPFLPMAPLQVLTNNLLYDFSQTTIPTDNVDAEYLAGPRKWEIGNITRFMLFVGPISSIFDYATYFTMLYVFGAWTNPALFQTGWFVESLLTQTLIIHIIRTAKIPFIQSQASTALITTSLVVCAVGIWLPFSPLANAFGFKPLPPLYWPIIAGFLLAYAILTHLVKSWFIRRWGV